MRSRNVAIPEWNPTICRSARRFDARNTTMPLTQRPYQTEDDYWRIRAFLREVFLLNDRREWCWHVGRLDYWRWHLVENCRACDPIGSVIFIWETQERHIA